MRTRSNNDRWPTPPVGPTGDTVEDANGASLSPPAPCLDPTQVADAVHALDVSLRRPTEPDLASVTAMWQRCTLATRLGRFHAPVPTIPATYLDAVRADPAASVVAIHDRTNTVVALASLIRNDSGESGELGVLVEDTWQHRGIGRRLVTHLVTAAPTRGITLITAAVLAERPRPSSYSSRYLVNSPAPATDSPCK